MSRTTIDYGIDLGTTNSAVAVLRGTVTDIIKNNQDNDITPSAVFIDKRGQVHVGHRAKNRLEDEASANDVHIEFKRRMGTDSKYEFKTTGRVLLPEEVSAEVLKSLRGDILQRTGEDVQACVITVPAAFEQRQCAATRKAGEIAGFYECPLIQEPVAAALAYGFQAEVAKGYWLVYDFGGGTFDAAIMKAEDGTIHVVNHGGDNFLGGSNIDWDIVEKLILPELKGNYNLPNFVRGNKKWTTAFAIIKRAAEDVKIQLSRSDSAYLEGCQFKDADGEQIELNLKLTRDDLINVAEPIIMRSVEICKRVLKEKNFSPSAIERVILVGGPTLAPYFREILKDHLGIHLDHSVDPLTVVACGAAIFAGTQRLEGKAMPKASAGEFNAKLSYKNMGPETDPRIVGAITSEDGTSMNGFTVEIINRTPEAKALLGWRSGRIPLKEDGKFKVYLEAEAGVRNSYELELLDGSGRKQTVIPDTLVYTVTTGAAGVISEQPIINSIAVALANNETDVFFKKGDPLPAKSTKIYRTTFALQKGASEDVLKVPVVEGNMSLADRNKLLGHLEIKGSHIRRDLPVGTEIEVTLHIDSSRIINATAYIPMLDEEIKAVIDGNKSHASASRLLQEFQTEKKRLDAIRQKAGELGEDISAELPGAEELNSLENLIHAAEGDPDAALKADSDLLALKIRLDHAEDIQKWPETVAKANKALLDLDNIIKEIGNAGHRERAAKIRKEVNDLIQQKAADPLRKKIEQVEGLAAEVLLEHPAIHIEIFKLLYNDKDKMRNPAAAENLFQQGLNCMNKNDIEMLKNVNRQLFDLLPRDVAQKIQQKGGYGSGMEKKL